MFELKFYSISTQTFDISRNLLQWIMLEFHESHSKKLNQMKCKKFLENETQSNLNATENM